MIYADEIFKAVCFIGVLGMLTGMVLGIGSYVWEIDSNGLPSKVAFIGLCTSLVGFIGLLLSSDLD